MAPGRPGETSGPPGEGEGSRSGEAGRWTVDTASKGVGMTWVSLPPPTSPFSCLSHKREGGSGFE